MREKQDCNCKVVNVWVYRRWSSDQQSDGDSGRRQTDLAERWCRQRGLSITAEETDDGISAFRGKNRRPGSGLDRLINRLKLGDYLLVEDHDRLTREDWLTGMNLVADIVGRGAVLVTLDNGNEIDGERFRRDPGCFLPAILRAHTGHDEDNKKSVRIKETWAARKAALSSGKAANMHLPCWLGWNKEAKKPVLVESNARVIRKMFALALKGLGCQTIARRLHKNGEKLVVEGKRRERVLTTGTSYVWRTLRNKLAIGYGVYVQPPQPGVYPPVVDEQTFYAVQQRLETNKHQTAPRSASTSSLFTGLARCNKCGGTLCRFTQIRKGKRYEYLVCSDTLHKHGKCGMTSIRYDAVEKSFLQLLSQTDLVRRAMTDGQAAVPSVLDSLSGQLADAENQVIKLMTYIKSVPNPARAFYEAVEEEEHKAANLRQQIEAERGKLKAETPGLEGYQEFCDRFAGRMEQPEYRDSVKALLRDFVLNIEVKLGCDEYVVALKGAKQPIKVTLHPKGGCLLNPAPACVLGREPIAQAQAEAAVQAGAKGVLGVVKLSPA